MVVRFLFRSWACPAKTTRQRNLPGFVFAGKASKYVLIDNVLSELLIPFF